MNGNIKKEKDCSWSWSWLSSPLEQWTSLSEKTRHGAVCNLLSL